jgi:RHS repeat-associated protein
MSTLERIQYGFDRDSRRTWKRRALTTNEDDHYGYDGLSQVINAARGKLNLNNTAISGRPANEELWNYDPTGNWQGYNVTANGSPVLEQSRVHDRGNRLTQIEDNPNAMILDRAGRMCQMSPDAAGNWTGKLELTWDAWSRITSVKNNGTVVGTYEYDGLTRRITRTVSSVKTHSYYNQVWRPLEERKGTQTSASMHYLWGARHRDDLVRRDRVTSGTTFNETRYVLMDYFSPAAITDATGAVIERYSFSAFGVRRILAPDWTARTTSESVFEFGFQGQFLDTESGLINYGYRYFTPHLGRWTCKDPIEEQGGPNLYGFLMNDGVNAVDYLGEDKLPAQKPNDGQTPGNPKNPNDYGKPVDDSEFPSEDDRGGEEEACQECKCEQKEEANSETGASNLGRPTGEAGTGKGGKCKVGDKKTMKYEGQCTKADKDSSVDCSSKTCAFYVRWVCMYDNTKRPDENKTHWGQDTADQGSAYSKCK